MKKKLLKDIQQEAILKKSADGKIYTGVEPILIDNTLNTVSISDEFKNKIDTSASKQELTDATADLVSNTQLTDKLTNYATNDNLTDLENRVEQSHNLIEDHRLPQSVIYCH